MQDKLLSRTQVAEILGVPARTLAAWAYEGTGPRYYRVGKRAMYRAADLEAWLEGRAREPKVAVP